MGHFGEYTVRNETLLQGVSGTYQTLERMAEFVRRDARDPKVREVALTLTANCGGHQFDCEIRRLFEFVREEVTFRRDPVGQERVADSLRTLRFKTGDCDDKVVLLASLLGALGHRSRFVVYGVTPQKFSHVALEALSPTGWVSLDPTPERSTVGWTPSGHRSSYDIWPKGWQQLADPPRLDLIDITGISSRTAAGSGYIPGITVPLPAPPVGASQTPSWAWMLVAGAGILFAVSIMGGK